jgi:hypothetical protein
MASQKDHLERLAPAYKEMAEALQDDNIEDVKKYLVILGEHIQGLDMRLINDDILARVAEGSSKAIVALASKNSPQTLNNRSASNSVDGVLVDRATIFALFDSIKFASGAEDIGHVSVLFFDCLQLLTRMFESATDGQNAVLKHMAERAMLPETPSS